MPYTLADLDAMSLEKAQSLPFEERDRLLDLILDDGRHNATQAVSHRVGLYGDYFEEDYLRMLKVKAVKVTCRGITESSFDGVIIEGSDDDQYRAAFRHVETALKAAATSFDRVVTMVVFLTNMDNWPRFNEIYREFVRSAPCRAVIGTPALAEKPLKIEIVNCIAYKVRP